MKLCYELRKVHKRTDRRVRKSDANISLALYWTVVDDEYWKQLKDLLSVCATKWLTGFDYGSPVEIYMAASDQFWSAVLTRRADGKFRPAMFLNGKFNVTQLGWTINERKLFHLMYMLKRYDYFLVSCDVTFYTDHKNREYTSKKSLQAIKGPFSSRIVRWNLILIQSGVTVKHIPAVDNVLVDLLSRWGYSSLAKVAHVTTIVDAKAPIPGITHHFTRCEGWTDCEVKQLRLLIQKFGVGTWKEILESFCYLEILLHRLLHSLLKVLGSNSIRSSEDSK